MTRMSKQEERRNKCPRNNPGKKLDNVKNGAVQDNIKDGVHNHENVATKVVNAYVPKFQ